MKRWCAIGFITTYLMILFYGLIAGTLHYKHRDHMGMYFIVWDMFCGWDCYESRRHLVAEGESGQFYDCTPPWSQLNPYLEGPRHHYDIWGHYNGRVAENTLRHTDHEPIRQIIMVEEMWNKKYNMPEYVWSKKFDDPKQKNSYYYVRAIFDAKGSMTRQHYDWPSHLAYRALMNNPRLKEDIARSRPFMESALGTSKIQPAAYIVPPNSSSSSF